MDILNLWNDDPEEVLLDLGFGCDEPDLSGRIPARFINHQSQARGINLQVFLEAQKNRLDLENPDVSNRFRQLEVLQQVTTAFSSLVGSSSSPHRAPQGKDLSPEAQERRRRMGMLFRRASKKSLSHIHNQKIQDITTPAVTSPPCDAPEILQPPSSIGDKKVPIKRVKPRLLDSLCLSPLAEKQRAGPDPQPQPHVASLIAQEAVLRPWPLREGHPLKLSTFLQRNKSPGQARESSEMKEIHSFDEYSVTGSYMGGAEIFVRGVIRTNSCQSDSSGFLEEPFIPSLSQLVSTRPDFIKVLPGVSGGTTDSQSSVRLSYHPPSSPLPSPSLLPFPRCPLPEHLLVFGPSPSPVLLCFPKSDKQIPETETPPDHDPSPPASLPTLVYECLPPCSSSPKLQNVTHSHSPTLPSSSFTFLSPTSSPMQPASLIICSEEIRTEDQSTLYPHFSTLSHDSEGTACSTFSSGLPPTFSPPSPNSDCPFFAIPMSSRQSDSTGSPGNTQSERTDVALHENPLSASGVLSSLLPSSPYLPPTACLDFHCPASIASLPLIESLSQSPENNQKDSLFPDSCGIGLSDPPTNTQKKEQETLTFLFSQLDKDNPSAPPSLILDFYKFERGRATLPCLSRNPSIPVFQSGLSSLLHDVVGFIDPGVGRISDLTEKSEQQDRSFSHDDNKDPTLASPVEDVTHVKMNHLFLDTLQRNGKGEVEGERHSDTVQTREAVVYISDTESSADLSEDTRLVSKEVCNQPEIDPQVPFCSLHNELSVDAKLEELRKVCHMDNSGTESESLRKKICFHEEVQKDLIEIESLDLVFQTSVDGSEGENGDLDAFFQQLDTEGQVYWAEPIQVSNPTPVLEESGSFEVSDGSLGNSLLSRCPPALDSFSSTHRATPLSLSSSATMDTDQTSRDATAFSDSPSSLTRVPFPPQSKTMDFKPSSCSVSVQMSSSLSSHIVHRKDVPYMTDSKHTLLPSVLPLDTSTPFRAVQSWTDWQIQRNTLTKKLSHGTLHTVPDEMKSASETTQRPTLIISSSPSFPLLSHNWHSHDCAPGMTRNDSTVSVSVDKGLWPDGEEEVDRNGNEDEERLWEGNQTATMACCCSCDHQCTCCTKKSNNNQHTLGHISCSLDELEEMMLCLQQFCSVLSNMEAQLSEDQATVYSSLSDQDREKVRDIEELRHAVKQEAGELEMQLNELAHHYDNSLKMKMHRLLDEQSLLCSQLRVFPGTSSAPNRTVATQCCLLPWSTWNVGSSRQSPPGSESISKGLNCSPTKADKIDIVGFLQRLKESLRHSVNTDLLE